MAEGFFSRLRKALFGETEERKTQQDPPPAATVRERRPPPPPEARAPVERPGRDPLIFQVGFDFGTAYSKCIVRDINLNKAWVFVPPDGKGRERPFLLPSMVAFDGSVFSRPEDHDLHYGAGLLTHLKMVWAGLEGGAKDTTANTRSIAMIGRCSERTELRDFVRSAILYLLAGWMGSVKEEIRRRHAGFGQHPDDQILVNMAIPVADAKERKVRESFEQLLILAWSLADRLGGHPRISQTDLRDWIRSQEHEGLSEHSDLCFVYPEVSANVQGFVRSRVSRPGLYLFSDTGAGTVDQSVFLFSRNNGPDPFLAYLAAQVLPLGSSRVDQHAAVAEGNETPRRLEYWRKRKEAGGNEPLLTAAKEWVRGELGVRTVVPLASAKRKLIKPRQLTTTEVIFGGGGHVRNPYETGVKRAFCDSIFREPMDPRIVGVPDPKDLDLQKGQAKWLPRLSVAYGLSFTRVELAGFDFPEDNPDQPRPMSTRLGITAPTKDEC